MQKVKNITKLEINAIIQVNIEVLHIEYVIAYLKYCTSKKRTIIIHNAPNYDYHFLINEIVEEFKKKFTCLGEITWRIQNFSISIENEVAGTGKKGEQITKNIYLTD